MKKKILTLGIVAMAAFMMTGCSHNVQVIQQPSKADKAEQSTYAIKVLNKKGYFTPSATVATKIERNSTSTLQAAANTTIKNGYKYFAIDFPDAIANTKGSLINTAEEFIKECSYNTGNVFFQSNFNKKCNATDSGAQIRIISYAQKPLDIVVYNAHDVLAYLEENNLLDTIPYTYKQQEALE